MKTSWDETGRAVTRKLRRCPNQGGTTELRPGLRIAALVVYHNFKEDSRAKSNA